MHTFSFLTIMAASAAALVGQQLTNLDAFYGLSQSTALRVSDDEQRVFVADGATVTILDSSVMQTPLPIVAQVPVGASIVSMLPDTVGSNVLYVAGGKSGLFKMSTSEQSPCDPCTIGMAAGCYPVTLLDDEDHATPQLRDNAKLCLDVALMGTTHLVAAFGARGANELRVYDLATLRAASGPVVPTAIVAIPPHANPSQAGPAHALAVRAQRVYVALGGQGVAMVNLTNLAAPVVIQGPAFPSTGNPFPGQPGDVRDVAIVQGFLYAAVDGLGIAQMSLAQPWSAAMPVQLSSLSNSSGDPHYAYRLDTVETAPGTFLLAIAANGEPGMAHDAIPFGPWGAVSFDVGPGNLPSTPQPGADGLLVFAGSSGSGIVATTYRRADTTAWQGLQVRRGTGTTRSYELHRGTVVVRDVDNQFQILAERKAGTLQGKNPPRIGSLLAAPRLLLTSVDHYPLQGPFLSTCTPGCITTTAPAPGTNTNFSVITNFDGQWFDPIAPATSWLLRGSKQGGWWLNRITAGMPCGGTPPTWLEWKLESPPDQYGRVGRLAFMAHINDAWNSDLVLCTRTGTRDGLIAYSRSQLMAQALTSPSGPTSALSCGGPVSVCPVFTADTHPEFVGWQHGCTALPCSVVDAHFGGKAFSLDCDTTELFDPAVGANKWVSVTAAGYHSRDPGDPVLAAGGVVDPGFFRHAKLVLHDLSTNPVAPTVLARLYGATDPGNAVDVRIAKVGSSTYVVAADYGGHVQVFDITTAFAAPGSIITPVATWTLPLSPYDGLHENASEVVIDQFIQNGSQRTLAYVACYRRGVEVLDLSNLPLIGHVATLDTPGTTEGVAIRRIGNQKRLLVACRSGGVQVFKP